MFQKIKEYFIKKTGLDIDYPCCCEDFSMLARMIALEEELVSLSKQIVSYKDGRLTNIVGSDNEGWKELNSAFPSHGETTREYVHLLYELRNHEELFADHIPLPPFIVFPEYSPVSLGWRMGAGEDYLEYWGGIIRNLPKERLEEYCSRYDFPSRWMPDLPCGKIPASRAPFAEMPWHNLKDKPKNYICYSNDHKDCPLRNINEELA